VNDAMGLSTRADSEPGLRGPNCCLL